MAEDTPQQPIRQPRNPWNELISQVTRLWPEAPLGLIQYFHARRNQLTPWVAKAEDNQTIAKFHASLPPAPRADLLRLEPSALRTDLLRLREDITDAPSEEIRLRVLSVGMLIAAHLAKGLPRSGGLEQEAHRYLQATRPFMTSIIEVIEVTSAAVKPLTGLKASGGSPTSSRGRFSLSSFLKPRTRGKGGSRRHDN